MPFGSSSRWGRHTRHQFEPVRSKSERLDREVELQAGACRPSTVTTYTTLSMNSLRYPGFKRFKK